MQSNKSIKRNLAADIKRLAADGRSFRRIAELLGCSKGAISYHLSKGQKKKALERQRKYKANFQDPREVYLTRVMTCKYVEKNNHHYRIIPNGGDLVAPECSNARYPKYIRVAKDEYERSTI